MEPTAQTAPLTTAILGALCGALATAPMTLAMTQWHQKLPWWERYPLPPRLITHRLAEKARVEGVMSHRAETAATLVAHFGYGAAGGAVYSGLAGKVALPPVAQGVLFGLLVWMVSYLGLLPAGGILRSATEQPARRNLLMIGAHVIWGGALGALLPAITRAWGTSEKPLPRAEETGRLTGI